MSYLITFAEFDPAFVAEHYPAPGVKKIDWSALFTLSDGSTDHQGVVRLIATPRPEDDHSPAASAALAAADPADASAVHAALLLDIARVEAWLEANLRKPPPVLDLRKVIA